MRQIYRVLLNKNYFKKKILIIVLILNFIFHLTLNCISSEIYGLILINKEVITNYDLAQEIKLNKILFNKEFKEKNLENLLSKLTNYKIKEIEIKKNKIVVEDKIINQNLTKYKTFLLKKKDINNREMEEIIFLIRKQIEIDLGWINLINLKLRNQSQINTKEVNEISKKNNLDDNEKKLVLEQEVQKQFNLFSQTYFNRIKREFLIRKLK